MEILVARHVEVRSLLAVAQNRQTAVLTVAPRRRAQIAAPLAKRPSSVAVVYLARRVAARLSRDLPAVFDNGGRLVRGVRAVVSGCVGRSARSKVAKVVS